MFYTKVPPAAGACAAGTAVYRLYNNGQGGAPNHRYTTSFAVRAAMLAADGLRKATAIGVISCVPV